MASTGAEKLSATTPHTNERMRKLEEVYNSSSYEDSNKYIKDPELRPSNHSAANFSTNLEDGDADGADELVSGIGGHTNTTTEAPITTIDLSSFDETEEYGKSNDTTKDHTTKKSYVFLTTGDSAGKI